MRRRRAFPSAKRVALGRTNKFHGPVQALKYFGDAGSLISIASHLNTSGRSFATLARLGARVDAAVASAIFADLNAALARVPPMGLLGPYNRSWLVTRAAALLGVRCAANASTTWDEATGGALGYVKDQDHLIAQLKGLGPGATPLDVLTKAECGQEDVWFLPMTMCLRTEFATAPETAGP